jgi:molybdate transport system substrate-binding protein
MKRLLPLLTLALLAGCRTHTPVANTLTRAELTVSAAVSLKDAFNEIGRLYETRTGTKINFNFGASGVLQKQIEQGAPVDVFASADKRQMDELANKNLIFTATRHDFAYNTLVLILPRSEATTRELQWFERLAQPAVRKLAIGNPQTVPAGFYARQTLVNLNLWDKVQSKLVLAEDVRQVLDYVARAEVDAGFVYVTDIAPTNQDVFVATDAPATTHDAILYPIAVVKDSQHAEAALGFIALVLSPEGQAVLQKYGFISVLFGEG